MDNFHFDMTSRGADALKKALQLFDPQVRRMTGYSTSGNKLVLYWGDSPQATKLPFPMTLEQAADFAVGWLAHADYGREPDHDGSNSKGWRLHCDTWGIVDGDHYAFAAIQPVWAMHGK
jgi:hypothetical protein